MKMHSTLGAALMIFALTAITSCKKDSEPEKNNDNNLVTKKGLTMTSDQEVPAKNTPAYGTVDVTYHKDTHVLDYTIIWYSLSGNPTGAHFHGPALRGANAGIVHDFFSSFPAAVAGTFSSTLSVDGTKIIEDSLLAGKYYFNIHTAANPGGEIRAQVEF